MTEENLIELEIEIQAEDATEEELDSMARNLLSEIRETDVESVNLLSVNSAPHGSKGDAVEIGQLALAVLPTAVPSLIALIQAWILRGHGRTVKFKGKGIEFEGSPEDLEKLLKNLKKGKKK